VDPARSAGTRFRIVRHPDLRILRFEDESLVFNPRLWHTHFLNASAALILDCLEESPATPAELSGALVDEGGQPLLAAEQISVTMTELAGLGLIEPDDAPGAP
jgi:PqqD family protein of HPr-rel-A system